MGSVAKATLQFALKSAKRKGLTIDPAVENAAYALADKCGMDLNKHKKTIKTLFKPDKILADLQDAHNKEIILFTSLLFQQPEEGLEEKIRDNSILTSMGDMFNYDIQPQDLYDFFEAFDSACRPGNDEQSAASLIQAVENMREKVTAETGPEAQTLYKKLDFLAQGLKAINQNNAKIKNHVNQVSVTDKKGEKKLKADVTGFYENIEIIKGAIAPNQPSQDVQSSPPSQEAQSPPPSQEAQIPPPSQEAQSPPPSQEVHSPPEYGPNIKQPSPPPSPKEPGPQPSPKEPGPPPSQEAQSPPPSPKKPDPQPTRPPGKKIKNTIAAISKALKGVLYFLKGFTPKLPKANLRKHIGKIHPQTEKKAPINDSPVRMNLGSISTSTAAGKSRRSSTSGASLTRNKIRKIHWRAMKMTVKTKKQKAVTKNKSSKMSRPR